METPVTVEQDVQAPAASDYAMAFEEGRAAWPGIEVTLADFQRQASAAIGARPFDEWRRYSADLYLCCACALGIPRAVRALEGLLLSRVLRAVAHVNSDPEFVKEALQRLRYKLLVGASPKIASYRARGPLLAWLCSAATHLALDALRALDVERRECPLEPGMADTAVDPQESLMQRKYALAFQRALYKAIARLPAREREVLELKVAHGHSIERVGSRYGVHRATVARWFRIACERVASSVRAELAVEHGLSDAEYRSIASGMYGLLAIDFPRSATASGS